MARNSKSTEQTTRAAYERNLSKEFFATLDNDPTMVEELFYHRLRMSEVFIDRLNSDPAFARVERQAREMFVESTNNLISCSPTDSASVAEAQVNILAATKIMDIFYEAVTDGAKAKMERQTSTHIEDQ